MNTNTQNIPGTDEVLLEWTAPTHPIHVRTWRWYAIAGAVIALLLLFSIWTRAWSFTLVIIMFSAVLPLSQRRGPPKQTMRIFEHGFTIGKEFTPWQQCKGFWMLQGPNYIELHIERTQKRDNHVQILTGNVDYRDIFTVLSRFLPLFEDRQQGVLDIISRILKI